jgi:hypothetical protein
MRYPTKYISVAVGPGTWSAGAARIATREIGDCEPYDREKHDLSLADESRTDDGTNALAWGYAFVSIDNVRLTIDDPEGFDELCEALAATNRARGAK